MALSALRLVPVLVLQVGDEPLRRPKPSELEVTPGEHERAPVPVKNVGAKRLIALLVPKRQLALLPPLAPRARLPPQIGLPITEARQPVRAVAIQRALA